MLTIFGYLNLMSAELTLPVSIRARHIPHVSNKMNALSRQRLFLYMYGSTTWEINHIRPFGIYLDRTIEYSVGG